MYNPTTRLLTLLELLQARGEMRGDQIARELQVEERSVRRYIMLLRDIGIPIEGERGRHGGYSLRAGFRLPPLMFKAEEITTVMMGLLLMGEFGAPSPSALHGTIAKIERVLPDHLRVSVEAMRHSLIIDDLPFVVRSVSADHLIAFSVATAEQRSLHITYQASDEQTTRVIDPYGLVLHGTAWYIASYCHLREDMRVFRLDRVHEVKRTDESFITPDDFDTRQFVLNALAHMPGFYCLQVLLDSPLETAREIIPASMAVLERADVHKTLVRCYTDDPHWFARYLAQIELPFTVIAPDALRLALRALIDDLLMGIT